MPDCRLKLEAAFRSTSKMQPRMTKMLSCIHVIVVVASLGMLTFSGVSAVGCNCGIGVCTNDTHYIPYRRETCQLDDMGTPSCDVDTNVTTPLLCPIVSGVITACTSETDQRAGCSLECYLYTKCGTNKDLCGNSYYALEGTPCTAVSACYQNRTGACGLELGLTAGKCFPIDDTRLGCDDGNPCTDDTCDFFTGCTHTPLPAGTLCRNSTGDCDPPENCTANGECPADVRLGSGTVCRPSNGACDLAEYCDGSGPCPPDVVEDPGTVCRPSTGACDPAEVCDGSAACPFNFFRSQGFVCRSSTGFCDPQEVCDGFSGVCPSDVVQGSETVCRASTGVCDPAERCDGSGTCPPDVVRGSETVCRAATEECDEPETCTGSSGSCPTDSFKSSTTLCHQGTGVCDPTAFCTGQDSACPAAVPIGSPCDDNIGQTENDVCGADGVCRGSCLSPPSPCFANQGVLNGSNQCVYAFDDSGVCNDHNPCSVGDKCSAGVCGAGTVIPNCCVDGVVFTSPVSDVSIKISPGRRIRAGYSLQRAPQSTALPANVTVARGRMIFMFRCQNGVRVNFTVPFPTQSYLILNNQGPVPKKRRDSFQTGNRVILPDVCGQGRPMTLIGGLFTAAFYSDVTVDVLRLRFKLAPKARDNDDDDEGDDEDDCGDRDKDVPWRGFYTIGPLCSAPPGGIPSSSNDSVWSSAVGVAAGTTIGVVALVGLIVAASLLVYRRRRGRQSAAAVSAVELVASASSSDVHLQPDLTEAHMLGVVQLTYASVLAEVGGATD